QQSRQRSIGQYFAFGLAARAVVRFVFGVANALNFGAADGAGLAELAVDGEVGAEGRDVAGAGEFSLEFVAETLDPHRKRLARRAIEPRDLLVAQFLRELYGRELGGVENLVRVRIADSIEHVWIGEGALDRVILSADATGERLEIRFQHADAARIH